MDVALDEKKPLLETRLLVARQLVHVRVYRRRWWVAFIMLYSAILNGMMWNTFGIIVDSLQHVFGWSNGNIATIANLTNFTFIATVIPVCMLMDAKGLRLTTIGSTVLLFIACLIRCFTLDPAIFFGLSCVTGALAGTASIVPYAGPSLVASVWFPPHQRSLISGIIAFSNYIGGSLAFIVAPIFVPDPEFRKVNVDFDSSIHSIKNLSGNFSEYNNSEVDDELVLVNLEEMKTGILHFMYLFAGLATMLMLCTLQYFPNKPPTPPSYSASMPRTNYKRAIIDIMKNKQHWFVVVAGSLPRGVIASWTSVLGIPARYIGISQEEAGMIDFCTILIGTCSGLAFSRLAYRLGGRCKELTLSVAIIGLLCSIWAALMFTKVIPANVPSMYVSCVMVGITTFGTVPLFYEMLAEAAFPVSEGVSGGLYTLVLHAISVLYFGVMSIPGTGDVWMTWSIVGACALVVPLLAVFKERNKRSEMDRTVAYPPTA